MADLNSLIAQGVQFKAPPDPFAQYAQMQQLQQGEQANQLGQMQMQEYRRGMEETNAMRRLDPTSATYLQDITRISPEKGFAFAKMQREAKTAGTEGQIKEVKLLTDKLGLLREEYRMADTPEKYVAVHQKSHKDPVLGPWFASMGATPEQGFATIQNAISTGKFDELRAGSMQSVAQILKSMEPLVVGPSSSVLSGGVFKQAPAAPPSVSPLAKLQAERAALPPGSPLIPQYDNAIRKETQFAPQAVTNVQLPKQEGAFEAGVGAGQSKRIFESQTAAQDAVSIIDTVKTGRDIMKSGMITGVGADFLVNLNQGLKTVGIDFGYADAAANSQAYAANMAQNVGKTIKQFGAGTGLSDADRQYAEKMAAGKITLDAKALNKILDINERAARNVITRHNKDVKGIKTNIPLEVEMPPEDKAPGVTAPPAAVLLLRSNPNMKSAFDAKYGAGAADRALKGQ